MNLHSTVVLLKGQPIITFKKMSYSFTFYCSSIKRKIKILLAHPASAFTFYCSSIKSLRCMIDLAGFELDLHSTVVLLKEGCSNFMVLLPAFTFYCSSIKSDDTTYEASRLMYIYILL